MPRCFMDGNEAVARAAVLAGCTFFAGYPITPATTLFQHMLNLLPPEGGICLQGEDEIASLGFCLGASMAGRKVMTATSGPGLSLFSEQISFAIAGEIPAVIVDVQRLGPSTGSATKGADGDIQFLRWNSSGGLPVIVLAPVDVCDCFWLTREAFNLAERYRSPVFIASNKEVAMTKESVDLEFLELPPLWERVQPVRGAPFLPFGCGHQSRVPPFLPIGDRQLVRQTSSTHGADGYITADSNVIREQIVRRFDKIQENLSEYTFVELDAEPEAEILIITYGVTARAAREALLQLRDRGRRASLLVLKTLYPVPEDQIVAALAATETVLVVEMNMGQYVREIERLIGQSALRFYGKMNGELIHPREILEAVG